MQEGKISPERLIPYGPFAADSLLEYDGLKPILPFLGGRSGTACRVVILPFAGPVDAHVVTNDGRWQCIGTESPPMPTVGAGSSQREDSPAHPPPSPCAYHANPALRQSTVDPTVFVATWRAASRSKASRCASPKTRCVIPNRDAARHVATNAPPQHPKRIATNASPQQEAVLVHLGFYLLREGF